MDMNLDSGSGHIFTLQGQHTLEVRPQFIFFSYLRSSSAEFIVISAVSVFVFWQTSCTAICEMKLTAHWSGNGHQLLSLPFSSSCLSCRTRLASVQGPVCLPTAPNYLPCPRFHNEYLWRFKKHFLRVCCFMICKCAFLFLSHFFLFCYFCQSAVSSMACKLLCFSPQWRVRRNAIEMSMGHGTWDMAHGAPERGTTSHASHRRNHSKYAPCHRWFVVRCLNRCSEPNGLKYLWFVCIWINKPSLNIPFFLWFDWL